MGEKPEPRLPGGYTIAARHLVSFLFLIALPTLVVILLTGYAFRGEIVRITTEQRLGSLEQTSAGIDEGAQEFALMAASLVSDRSLTAQTGAYALARAYDQRYLISLSLDEIFNRYFITSRQLGSFFVFFSDGSGPYKCRNYSGVEFSDRELRSFLSEGAVRPGFVKFLDTAGPAVSLPGETPSISLVITMPRETSAVSGLGGLLLSFRQSQLGDFIAQKNDVSTANGKYRSTTFLVGTNGLVLASSDVSLVGADFDAVKSSLGGRFVVLERGVATPKWRIAEAIDIKSLTSRVDALMLYVYAALIVILALSLGYNTLFYRQIVSPLHALAREMGAVSTGNFSARVEPCRFPELNSLGDSFNVMVAEVATLTDEIKAEQAERVKSEIEALRYQLNPHFLCNTLNSIRMMALISKNEAISKMTASLMTITEDNLGRDDTIYPLSRELKNIDSYVYIMKVRYGDSFEFFKDVDSSLLSLGVPSMILQPLVENSILHGLHGLPRQGSITVAAAIEGDSLRLDVRDNGFGMDEERLERIFDPQGSGSRGLNRIGLYNVRRRLVLLYGPARDIRVSSYPGEGTVVTLMLPILDPPEEPTVSSIGVSREGSAHD